MISVYLPETADDVYARAGDIMAAILQEQGIVPEPDIIDFMAANPHCVYLFYQDGELMAFIRLDDKEVNPDLGRNTVEIHGAIMPAFKGQSDEPSRFVLEAAFKVKRNVIAKIAPDNLGAIGWCRRWGFRKINKEGGKTVYRLKRGEYQRLQA